MTKRLDRRLKPLDSEANHNGRSIGELVHTVVGATRDTIPSKSSSKLST
jgi:hypothetical protein